MNFGRKMMKAGVAAVAAIATLGAGGVVASTAFAGGGGGNQPGTGGDLAAVQFWQYKDDASGAWGPATSLDSVRAAMNNAGVTLEGDGVTKAQAALDQARTECETGFQRRHPGEGNGDCRVVAVGAVPAVIGGNYIYNGSGAASPTGTGGWYDNWNKYVAPGTYQYGSTVYRTSYPFDDDPSNSVDAIMRRNVEASSKPSIVVIVLDKYQPAPPSYHLSVSTQAAEMSGQAGDTKDASDVITLSSDGSKTENVNGTATLHWRGIDGTEKTVAKQFTASNKGSATVSASFKDMDASWESWPAGKRWWDVDVAKQGNMAEAVSHKGENDGKESGEKTTTPPEKWLTNEAGQTVRDGNDSIASGSLYTAHIKAHSNASGKFWIYDTIDTRDVVIGGTEQDDVSKVTVTDANGNIVPADISIDDSIDGKRVVKAHATAPHSGLYTLNVPQSAKPTGGDYEINDGSVACWNGDNGTGSLADCQTGNSDSVGKVTPTPDKVWVLDESGALVAEDKGWTNQQGVDQKTFLVGDQVGVVVNGSIPSHLLNPLASYSITDDLTGSIQWIDWKSGKVFVDGKDVTDQFDIVIDRKAGTATATAKSAYIAKTMFRNSASKVRFYLTGTIKKGATEGKKIQLTNKAYEKWNNETVPTNEPPVFVWTPNPNKAWAMKVGGKWQLTVDPTKSDKVGGDDKYYRLGDEVAAVVSGTLPTGLGRVPEIAWTDDFANVDSILDLKDTSNIKVYEQDTTDEANAQRQRPEQDRQGRDRPVRHHRRGHQGHGQREGLLRGRAEGPEDREADQRRDPVRRELRHREAARILRQGGGRRAQHVRGPEGRRPRQQGRPDGRRQHGGHQHAEDLRDRAPDPQAGHRRILPGRRPVQHRHQDRVPRPDRGIHRARGPADPCGPGIFGDRHQAERHLFRVHHREQADPGDHRPGNRRHHPEERLQGAVGREGPLVRGHVRQGLGCRQLEGRLQPARAAALRGQGERGRAHRQDRRQQGRADRQQRRHPVQQGRERAADDQALQAGHAEGPDHQHRRQDRAAGRQGVLPRQHRRLQAHRHRLQGMATGHDGRLRPGVPDPRREARGDP